MSATVNPAETPLLVDVAHDLHELLHLPDQRHHVGRLELFGSATSSDFDPTESDLDFLVEFAPLSPSQKADAYFGLLHDA
jgi:hypothetical protein